MQFTNILIFEFTNRDSISYHNYMTLIKSIHVQTEESFLMTRAFQFVITIVWLLLY